MRSVFSERLELGRLRRGRYGSRRGDRFGAFLLCGPGGADLKIIATDGTSEDGAGWEHVSVSIGHRTPNWREMCFVKELFWGDEETVIQFHPRRSEYVNCHPNCLHLWRPHDDHVRLPPSILVGPKHAHV